MLAVHAPPVEKPRPFHELIELHQDELSELEAAYVLYIVQKAREDFAAFCFACYPGYGFPLHLQTLCDTLNTVEHTPNARVMVTCPPRHGKSLTCSVMFPAWYLGRNPDKKMITASYIGSLTAGFAGQVRDIMEGKAYQLIFPTVKIAGRARGGWGIVGRKGGLMATGVTSAITGFGADCLPGETPIRTESGTLQLRTLIQSWYNTGAAPRVLSYDHAGALVYRRVVAVAERTDDELYTITTERGKAFRATGNHRVYVDGFGYRRVSALAVGDCVLSLRERETCDESSLQGVLRQPAPQHGSGVVCQLRRSIRAQGLRARQAITQGLHALLLHQCMSVSASSRARLSALPDLRQADQQGARKEVLQPGVHSLPQDSVSAHLCCVWRGISAQDASHGVLLQYVRGCRTFCTYAWFRQFALQGWNQLRQVVPGNASVDSGSGWGCLRRLWGAQSADTQRAQAYMVNSHHSPYRPQSTEQSGGQPDYVMPHLSRYAPQIERDTISRIERISGCAEPVYDIQVEGTSNFFAGEVLVHNCLLIDDPIRDAMFADSPTWRQHLWDWFTSTAYTRLHPGAPVFVIACMTGDTPVLMADGIEKPLARIQPGDVVATYEDGRMTTARVLNHASNGYDSIYRITTKRGIVVRANARHPFLVVENGELKWTRVQNLTTGITIVGRRDRRENGPERLASTKVATSLLSVAAIATRTITKSSGHPVIAPIHTPIPTNCGSAILSTATASRLLSTMRCWPRRMASVPFASVLPMAICTFAKALRSALTTITTVARCAGYSATTATLPWAMSRQQPLPNLSWSTCDFITDEIVSIEPDGVAEVFDVEIERTGNYIANGLVSHNTRWHYDDLSGRLMEAHKKDPEAAVWNEVFFEAVNDKGQALWPERYDEKALRQIKATVGTRVWNALYQGRPTPDEGGLFKRWMFRKVLKALPVDKKYRLCRYWDKAGTDGGGDYTVGALMAIDEDKRLYLVHVVRGQWSALEREQIIEATAKQDIGRYGELGRYTVAIEQEPGSGGKESAEGTIRRLAGFRVKADKPEGQLTTRADPLAAQMEAGNVYLVEGAWIEPLIDEFCQFPLGEHDDQIAGACGAFKMLTGIKAFRYELL